ncbi:Clp protease N-terminal domain-containing protein [Streptomyces sp. FIT100]|uniref:Clp protease N-terminal domain-containing protein n=1 Tax=Streptomyces sp. FIT100 TaxID=2837956 RepID=UPI0021C7A804|nr:Clp protease N-terminal domain-containing protein [Streptomyces sp. FIT100]UUN29143.1 peptidase [Streptomyces sp. FIT100]
MFERFTKDARAVVTGAVAQAERADADSVTDEHLLLSLLDLDGGRVAFAFGALGVTDRRASLEAALADARRRGGMTKAETEALAGLGIDVAEVVARVEEAHGAGALAGAGRSGRSGRVRLALSGHRPFTPGAKKVIEQSLRVALGRKDRSIGAEHLLLALAARPGIAAEVLAEHGATYGALERVMFPRS